MKRIFFIAISLMLFLCACTNSMGESRTYLYEDLNSKQQSIVNGIYDSYSSWKSVQDSGKAIRATKVNFLYEENVLLFAVYYDEGNDGVGYFVRIMEVGENGELNSHKYSNTLYDEDERAKERVATMAAITGEDFPTEEEKQKDVLANALGKLQEEK